jgi:hypothetical protein
MTTAHPESPRAVADTALPASPFAQTYREAREKFLAAVDAAGLDVQSHVHPLLGRDGETLALDICRAGSADAESVLIVSSACHGVEGFCGSGIQVDLLGDAGFLASAQQAGVAVVFVHALNPWGFSWWRRTTHENIDLNRNFHDFCQPLPENPGYDEIAHLVVPKTWPPSADVETALARYVEQRGLPALQTAISAGQHRHPQGLFYGGVDPGWSHLAVRHLLRDHARSCRRLGWIDLHTGLGPSGVGERIACCRSDDAPALARARTWWGEGVTSIYDGSSSSALLSGMMWTAAYEECTQAEYTGIALEFGTLPLLEVMQALRADQWLENHPEIGATQSEVIKRATRAAFYVDSEEWKTAVLGQGREVAGLAVMGLKR